MLVTRVTCTRVQGYYDKEYPVLLQLPLVACLGLLSAFPDWMLQKVDSTAEWVMSVLLGEWGLGWYRVVRGCNTARGLMSMSKLLSITCTATTSPNIEQDIQACSWSLGHQWDGE